MPNIIINIKDCSHCPHWKAENFYSTDGWDRMEDWVCYKNPDKPRKISGAVEWHDKIPVPDWCELLLTNKLNTLTNE